MAPSYYSEDWSDFGESIKEFVKNEGKELFAEFKPHIIMGFSTGGAIVAHTLASYARDIYGINLCPEGCFSTLNVPPGISNKKYDSPCFGITEEGDPQDIENIETALNLIDKYMEDKLIEKIHLLIVDDNITGSRRLLYYENYLKKQLKERVDIRLLAYVKNPNFRSKVEIKEIKKFPEKIDYFIMPWHSESEHPDSNFEIDTNTHLNIVLHIKEEISDDSIIQDLKYLLKVNGFTNINEIALENIGDINPRYSWAINAEKSNTVISIGRTPQGKVLIITYLYSLTYVPKACLKGKRAFDYAFCELARERPKDICYHCIFFNCNRKLINDISKLPFVLTAETVMHVEDDGRFSTCSEESKRVVNLFLRKHVW